MKHCCTICMCAALKAMDLTRNGFLIKTDGVSRAFRFDRSEIFCLHRKYNSLDFGSLPN